MKIIACIGSDWLENVASLFNNRYKTKEYSWLLLSVIYYQRSWIEYPLTVKYKSIIMHGALDIITRFSLDGMIREKVVQEHREIKQIILELLDLFIIKYRKSFEIVKNKASVAGTAASLYGMKHSLFGKFVFVLSPSSVVTFTTSYVDPRQPIPAEHIQKAAKAAGIPLDKIDEAVRSLSAHMGWDITKGSLAGKL